MKLNSVKAFAPATIANFIVGYDILGCAVNNIGDEVIITPNESNTLTFEVISKQEELNNLPKEKNVVFAMVQLFLQQQQLQAGLHIQLHKHMPLNSGLGSSAASSVAALVAVNAVFNNPLNQQQLLALAVEGERIACGNAHADNVAPCLLGGMVLITETNPLTTIQLPTWTNMYFAIIHPHIDVPTRLSRQILKPQVSVKNMVQQTAHIAAFVSALYEKDETKLKASLQDKIITPQRAPIIPGFYDLHKNALLEGATAFGISGSGPTMFALCNDEAIAKKVSISLQSFLQTLDIESDIFTTNINTQGAVATIL